MRLQRQDEQQVSLVADGITHLCPDCGYFPNKATRAGYLRQEILISGVSVCVDNAVMVHSNLTTKVNTQWPLTKS